MKISIAGLFLAALLCAQEFTSAVSSNADTIGQYISLHVMGTDEARGAAQTMREHREDMRRRCIQEGAKCFSLVIEKDGKRLADIDLDGVWREYGSREDIADVMFAAFSNNMAKPEPKSTK